MTLRERPQALERLSADARTSARNEAGVVYAQRLRSTIFVQALILSALWASTSYPKDYYNVLGALSIPLALGITIEILAISARKTIWKESSNRWYGMVAVGTLLSAGSLGLLLAHSLASYGYGNWNSTMAMIWNTVAVASSIVNLAPNTKIFGLQVNALLMPALGYSLCLHTPDALYYAFACIALFLFSVLQGKQVNTDFWGQLASRFLEEQRGKEIDAAWRAAEQAKSGAERARRNAEEAAKARSEFLANMSHEIRTPMNAVMGMTSLILDQNLPAETIDCVNTIRSSSDALLTIINDILDFSKIESGKLDLEDEPFCLRDCVEEVLELLANKAAEKGLELVAQFDSEVAELVVGDITRTRQILLNLVGNAVKFTQYGEVVVSVGLKKHGEGKTMLHLAVRDTGIGIPQDKVQRLFQSFSQVDASTTRRFGGTGLGLAISKRLSELMSGRIWVTSQPDIGSVFQLEIPYRPAAAQPGPQPLSKGWEGKRVLVLDDNETALEIIGSYLVGWKLSVDAVDNVKLALEALRNSRWDALLVDSQMPEMEGVKFAHLVSREFGIDTPQIVLLTSGNTFARDAIGKSSIAAIIPKPIRRHQLQRVLDQVFNGKSENQKAPSTKIFDSEFAERAPLRILLAEDNPVNQKVAVRMLERLGYRLDAVGNGLEVLDALQRQHYDIVLMDVQMPEMNGLDATRRIISNGGTNRPWITALTAGAMKENRDECLDAGVDDFLTKPINVQELEQALKRCFDSQTERAHPDSRFSEHDTIEV
jgi:signal transduction histidine kinase/DNA-binding response OmpR family regulator